MTITLPLIEHILTGLIDPVESRAAGLFVYNNKKAFFHN